MKYTVKFLFRDEKGKLYRKHFEYNSKSIILSPIEILRWAELFGAEKIIFDKVGK